MASSKPSFRSYFSQPEDLPSEEDAARDITPPRLEKKKRLTAEQVRSLERSFEMENRPEPDTKQKLANDLGLQPRQIAIWFQNRRARWKIKRLEQDYAFLKSQYDTVVLERERLRGEVNRLTKELEAKNQNKRNKVIERKHENNPAQEEILPPEKDHDESKILTQDSPGFQCDMCNDKETSFYSDQTDISSPFQCAVSVLQDHNIAHSEFTRMSDIRRSVSHTSDCVSEQIGHRMEENFLLADQYYLGPCTTEFYDTSWLWLS